MLTFIPRSPGEAAVGLIVDRGLQLELPPAHAVRCMRRLLANLYNGNVYLWNYNDSVSGSPASRGMAWARAAGAMPCTGMGAASRGAQMHSPGVAACMCLHGGASLV